MESIRDYKCLSCGAGLRFEPNLQKWTCDYCRSVFEKAELENFYNQKEARDRERAAELGLEDPSQKPVVEMDSYHCKSCGAEIVGDPETIATFCLYCKSPTIIKARMQGEFNPRYVIPFKIDQKKAKELYAKWIKSHFLAPRSFKEDEEIEKIRGVYAPFWLYHSDHVHVYSAGVGETVRTWRSGNTEYTETSYYDVVREGEISYQNIPVDASTKMEDRAMVAIEPFNYAEMCDFSMDYMTGFFAERFDENKDQLESRAKTRMDEYSKEKVRSTIQYSRYTPSMEDVSYQQINGDYSLLPVYILTNIYQGKTMQYVVNGQTGKIYGEVPISKGKLASVAGIAFVIFWLLSGLWGGIFG
ncbi:DNA helicase PriA [Clostridiales bacterium COT073_COT-073]|nr:DNA helicase PriA [Clostridiales bacterium COT073_COT-073]